MKTLYLNLLVIACSLFPFLSFAQPNSVTLLDGTNNVISTHSSIQEAYNTIPSTLTQAYEIELSGSYNGADESFPVVFINKSGASAINTINVTVAPNITLIIMYHGADTSSVFVFDNADWITINGASSSGGAALSLSNTSDTVKFPQVHFMNGSCNNTLRRCALSCSGYTDSSAAIHMGYSPANSSGNSDNLIDACRITGGLLVYITQGSANNPNRNNRLYQNLLDTHGTCVWERGGTGNLYIDSNRINAYCQGGWVAEFNFLLIENLKDSLFLTKNRMMCYMMPENATPIRGLYIKGTSGLNAYISMINNSLWFGEFANHLSIFYDSLTYATGIEFDGTTEARTDIYHNTIRMRGKKNPGSSSLAFTTPFKITTSSNSIYNIENNIFTTERFGGTNATNVALSINNTSGTLNIDNNTYNSFSPDLAQYNNILYTTMASYQAVNIGNENSSNNTPVEFVNAMDHRLYNTSVNNTMLQGVMISGITEDIEGDARVFPYRGCDEYEVNCLSTIYNPFSYSQSACPGDTIILWHAIPLTGNGNVYQWQSRPAGTTQPFTDIPGAIYNILITAITQSTDFRIIDSCATGGLGFITISNIVTVNALPLPSADGIAETHNGLTYDFNGINVQNTNTYQWDFGDGSGIDTNATPQHTYGTDGTYTVTLILTNNCGSDTVTLQVNMPVSVPNTILQNEVSMYPNPATNATTITCTNDLPLRGVTVYNVTGAIVSSTKTEPVNTISINTSSLPGGLYIVRIETEKGTIHKPLQVMK